MTERYSAFDLLQWLSKDTADAFLAEGKTRHFPARSSIYLQSEEGRDMFRLVSGTVRLSLIGDDGRDLLYQLFSPGDCFGTSSVVDEEPRPHTAEAFDHVTLQVFDRATINRLRQAHPELNDALLKLLSRHMRLLSDYFAAATFDEVSSRLAQRLLDITETFGVARDDGIGLSRRLSQSELAAMVGTARQTVNKVLHEFQELGIMSLHQGSMLFTDLAKLREIALKGARLQHFAAVSS